MVITSTDIKSNMPEKDGDQDLIAEKHSDESNLPTSMEIKPVLVSTLPDFKDELEMFRYFGVDPRQVGENSNSADSDSIAAGLATQIAQSAGRDVSPNGSIDGTFLTEMEPEADRLIDELSMLLATVTEAESVKASIDLLTSFNYESKEQPEPVRIELTGLDFADVTDAVIYLKDDAHAQVTGVSQAFFHDRSSGKIFGKDVHAFAYDTATVESDGGSVIAAGRTAVFVQGGWVGAKDETVAHVQGGAAVQANDDAIILADGPCMIDASGNSAVLVNSAQVRIRLLSENAGIILMDAQIPAPEVETLDGRPARAYQLVTAESPYALEKMLDLSLREAVRRKQLQ